MIIGVDAGRNGVKIMTYDQKKKFQRSIFDSKYSMVNFDKLRHLPILGFNEDNDIIASVDGQDPIAYGNVCVKIAPPQEIHFVTTDEIYLEKSIGYTLVAAGKMVNKDNEDVILGINLTGDNIQKDKEVIDKLKGKHKVIFYNTHGKVISEKIFNVTKVGVWFQGWIGIMSHVIKDDFTIDKEWARQEMLSIDIGRRTAIVQYINTLSPVENKTFHFGAEKYFQYIQDDLKTMFNIKKATHEIEKIITSNKTIIDKGKPVDMQKVKVSALKKYTEGLRNEIKENFDDYSPDKVIFLGGGAILFKSILSQMYENVEILYDPVFRNAEGLVKLLVRKFVKNKVGVE